MRDGGFFWGEGKKFLFRATKKRGSRRKFAGQGKTEIKGRRLPLKKAEKLIAWFDIELSRLELGNRGRHSR